ncbi:MarR family winged helix-turn-helix transcriptional regulator [Salibacterium salarium]|uniref:MarR family winged helix-turn-helix transcriptional regulator n=1 Tax=Salibacterium salarium TaxID=284579 RepID=UPI001639F40F|nr:MarR family transcriptional regulator [Salibacterium salarium]
MTKEELLKSIDESLFDLTLKIHEEFGSFYEKIPEKYCWVLILVSKYESLYVKELADLIRISPSSASQLLSKMEKEQYIVREMDPGQRRQTFIKIGKSGEKVLKKMEETREKISAKYLMKLPYEDLESFYDGAVKLKQIVDDEKRSAEK